RSTTAGRQIPPRRHTIRRQQIHSKTHEPPTKSQRLLFVNPARGLRLGAKPTSVPTPLSPEAIQTLAAAADTDPALKLLIALIGVHALYPHQARELPLAAVDFTGGRLSFGDIDHPLDAFRGHLIW
ncbi:hypothetical protein ACWDEN_47680, partial [Streptomyces sp. NPDC001153]